MTQSRMDWAAHTRSMVAAHRALRIRRRKERRRQRIAEARQARADAALAAEKARRFADRQAALAADYARFNSRVLGSTRRGVDLSSLPSMSNRGD